MIGTSIHEGHCRLDEGSDTYISWLLDFGFVMALAAVRALTVGDGTGCWRWCLPHLPPGGDSELAWASLKGSGMLSTMFVPEPAPGGAPGRHTCDGLCVGISEIEVSNGVCEEVEGAELDAVIGGYDELSLDNELLYHTGI
jgi:hypothetical protein